MELTFLPIDLERNEDACIAFRRDSYVCSFGSEAGMWEDYGPDGARYLATLRERLAEFPEGYVHVWQNDAIIGQLEMRVLDDPRIGYVSLFYLVPSVRGSEFGDQLHAYAKDLFERSGVAKVQLSVSPTNLRAIAYYCKHGWQDLGPRPGREKVNLMELPLGVV